MFERRCEVAGGRPRMLLTNMSRMQRLIQTLSLQYISARKRSGQFPIPYRIGLPELRVQPQRHSRPRSNAQVHECRIPATRAQQVKRHQQKQSNHVHVWIFKHGRKTLSLSLSKVYLCDRVVRFALRTDCDGNHDRRVSNVRWMQLLSGKNIQESASL